MDASLGGGTGGEVCCTGVLVVNRPGKPDPRARDGDAAAESGGGGGFAYPPLTTTGDGSALVDAAVGIVNLCWGCAGLALGKPAC